MYNKRSDMKICNNCKIEKPLEEYLSSNHGTCKVCNREKTRERNKKRYHEDPIHRQEQLARTKKYIKETGYWAKWRENNRDKIKETNVKNREYKRQWAQNQRQNNIQYRLKENIRSRINLALKNKSNSSEELLGCPIEEYVVYLEQQFDSKMNWGNYGKNKYWEIDHTKPISTFDLSNEEEVKKCFNYLNTKPLSVNENRKKGNKEYI
jgi:hypothetical protein